MKPLSRVAVAGIGGFARDHHQALCELENEQLLRVVGTSDPRERDLGPIKAQFDFAGRGVAVFDDFSAMLDAGCDWVTLSTPIPLHAPMHAACVQRRLPCYLEKPPTLDPAELEEMIALDARADRQTQVGFIYVYEPERIRLKERLLRGEFGRLERVSVLGLWPRDRAYYERNSWAGRLRAGDSLVLDSCMGNAMAHYVHNVLFFAGIDRLDSWGGCRRVEARLLRANPIEGADTVVLRGESEADIEIRLGLTHAGPARSVMEERLTCEKATLVLRPGSEIVIEQAQGGREVIPVAPREYLRENLRIYADYVGGHSRQLLGTLEHCRPFVQLNALAYVSTGAIHTVSEPLSTFDTAANRWCIPGIESMLEDFVSTGDFGVLQPLGVPEGASAPVTPEDLNRLEAVVSRLAGAAAG